MTRAILLSIILQVLVMTVNAWGFELVPRYSLEKNVLVHGAGTGERLYAMEAIFPLHKSMKLKAEAGGWITRQQAEGRRSSAYGTVQWGYRVEPGLGIFAEAYVGPTAISAPDSQLGSVFQISHDLALGWIDQHGFGLSVSFKHISNAGLVEPNRGRDFLGARFIIPIGGKK